MSVNPAANNASEALSLRVGDNVTNADNPGIITSLSANYADVWLTKEKCHRKFPVSMLVKHVDGARAKYTKIQADYDKLRSSKGE